MPVSVNLPSRYGREEFEVELWHGADELPTGLRRASSPGAADGMVLRFEAGKAKQPVRDGKLSAVVAPVLVPGDYEVRLVEAEHSRNAQLFKRRARGHLRFSIRDTGGPPLPSEWDYPLAEDPDWPSDRDPLRRLSAWMVPKDECEEPVFPEPPRLRLVRWLANDPETTDDDVYEPVERPFLGHLYSIEARFESAPPELRYRVTLGDGQRVFVERDPDDPRLYRSEAVSLLRRPEP